MRLALGPLSARSRVRADTDSGTCSGPDVPPPALPRPAAGRPNIREATVPDEYVLRMEASGEVTTPTPDTDQTDPEEAEQ